ncbi:MAG: ABC transporter permease [Planctomycetota bacterium]
MFAYIIRRLLFSIPIVIGVNVLLFALFFVVYSPDRIAREMLGGRNVTPEKIERWKREHNYHLPIFFNNGFDRLATAENRADGTLIRELNYTGSDGTSQKKPLELTGAMVWLPAAVPGHYRLNMQFVRGRSVPLEAELIELESGNRSPLKLDETAWLDVTREQAGPFVINVHAAAGMPDGEGHDEAGRIAIALYKVNALSLDAQITQTIFWQKGLQLLWFDFGKSDESNIPINYEIRQRMMPSLQITVPLFFISLAVNIFFAMLLAFWRATYFDHLGTILCVLMMSISILLFIVAGQVVLGVLLRWLPVSGFGIAAEVNILGVKVALAEAKYLVLPIIIGLLAGTGASVRLYRTLFLEEIGKDYIRTARAKGLPESVVLFRHALKNAMIPILTSVMMTIPFLFMGNLLLEKFYSIPGLGSFLIEAINHKDFAVVRAMVFLGSVLYVFALIATDIMYTVVDPRIRFN